MLNHFHYSKADWTGLLEYLLNYDFDLLFHDDDVDIVWQSLKDLFLSSHHMYVPVVVTRSAASYTPWFNGPLNLKLKCLRTLKRHHAANPTPTLQQRMLREELAFAECHRIAKSSYEMRLVAHSQLHLSRVLIPLSDDSLTICLL